MHLLIISLVYLSKVIEDDWGNAWEKERVEEAGRKKKILLDEAPKEKEKHEREAEPKADGKKGGLSRL